MQSSIPKTMRKSIIQSIRGKTLMIILLTSVVALLVAAIPLLAYEARAYREFLANDLATQADILARITAPALAFDDAEAALANLQLLTNRSGIVAGAVYRADGSVFARYQRQGANVTFPAEVGGVGPEIVGPDMILFHSVVENNERLGSIYLRAEYRLVDRIRDYLLILAGAMAISLLVAFFVSVWLQSSLTSPLLAIKKVAQRVVRDRDFSLRAPKTTHDEIGELADAFNVMLQEVGARQQDLETSNRRLQEESEERRNAEQALRVADAHKDEFLATLAHELRNPLAPLVNATSILRMGKAAPEDAGKAILIIERQLAQMTRLIEDLLDVSRISRGKMVLSKSTVDLSSLVRQSVETVTPLIEKKRQNLAVDLPEQPVFLHADPVRLSQVLSNLLNNASKYTGEEGSISLSAERVGNSVRVRVKDNGKGISPEALPQLFSMFMQEDHESSHRYGGGLGVGLTLAKRLVELHNGTIRAESGGPGTGSTFTVELPVLESAPVECSIEIGEAPKAAGEQYNILLVDDNVDFATSLAVLLRSSQYEVRIAHDAPDALALLDDFEPDIAFLDIGLPSMSGFELAELIRKKTSNGITMIAISGWGQPEQRRRARQAGFAHYLVKPVAPETIHSVLSKRTATLHR